MAGELQQQPSTPSGLQSSAASAEQRPRPSAPPSDTEPPEDSCSLGLEVEWQNGSLIVTGLAPDGSAAESGLVSVEDVILKAISLLAPAFPPMAPCTHAHTIPWASLMRITDALWQDALWQVYAGLRFGNRLMRRTCIWLQVQGEAVSSAEEAVALMAGQDKTLATVIVQVLLQALASLRVCMHHLYPLLRYIGSLPFRRKAAGSRKSCICSVNRLPALRWAR